MSNDFEITIDNAKLSGFLRTVPGRMKQAVRDALEESALKVQNRAKINAPVLTGNLRRSITHEVQTDIATVGTDVEYALAREVWSKKNGQRGYLRPALADSKDDIDKIFDKHIEKALKS